MNEKQRQHQEPEHHPLNDGESDSGGMSELANSTLGQLAAVDAMIDNILSSVTTGNYLESIRQRGGQ